MSRLHKSRSTWWATVNHGGQSEKARLCVRVRHGYIHLFTCSAYLSFNILNGIYERLQLTVNLIAHRTKHSCLFVQSIPFGLSKCRNDQSQSDNYWKKCNRCTFMQQFNIHVLIRSKMNAFKSTSIRLKAKRSVSSCHYLFIFIEKKNVPLDSYLCRERIRCK